MSGVVRLILAGTLALAPPAVAVTLSDLAPGTGRAELERALAADGVSVSSRGARELVVEAAVIPGVFELQRTLLRFDAAGTLTTASVQVLPVPGSSGEDVLELYAEVRHELLRRLGPPAWTREEGAVGEPGLILMALTGGDLVRIVQWEGAFTTRMGIPQRVDGDVVVEVLLSEEALPRYRLDWGAGSF